MRIAHLIQTNYFENPVAILWDAFSSRSVTCKIIIGLIHYQYIYQKQDFSPLKTKSSCMMMVMMMMMWKVFCEKKPIPPEPRSSSAILKESTSWTGWNWIVADCSFYPFFSSRFLLPAPPGPSQQPSCHPGCFCKSPPFCRSPPESYNKTSSCCLTLRAAQHNLW